ncbi:CtrA inhibitor SciP [Sphingorhabdus sp. Alg231-15]|uniref:CtrA inhibitor SciP n=1 Tax=Sphingorhabdus sp. Alg231-15 TaxID=1922222 RepID=UPI000D5522E8
MIENTRPRPAIVIGPLGEAMTKDDLPCPMTTRWVVRRKAEVVAAVNGGMLTTDEACDRYNLSLEEFVSWQQAIERAGMPGLRVTHLQERREQYQKA